jgi:DNA-binding transcriptional ArsR family regulator
MSTAPLTQGRVCAFNLERFFQLPGDNTRLRILNLIGDQEICVCYFVEILRDPQPKISRHLAYPLQRRYRRGATGWEVEALSDRHVAVHFAGSNTPLSAAPCQPACLLFF